MNEAPSRRTPGRRKAAFLAKYRPDVFPKEPRTIKTPLHGKISPPCIQNELILARYAPHVFKMPYKAPLEDTSGEHLAREGRFSLHRPLKSCMTSESCHARRIQLDESCHVRRIPLDESRHARWLHRANPAMLDGFTGRILSRLVVSVVQILPSRPGGSRWANPVGQSTLDKANGFHLRVRHCHFHKCPPGKST